MFRIFALQDAAAMLANLDTRPQPPRKPQTPVNIYIMQPRAPLVVRIRLAARKRDDPRTVDQCASLPLCAIGRPTISVSTNGSTRSMAVVPCLRERGADHRGPCASDPHPLHDEPFQAVWFRLAKSAPRCTRSTSNGDACQNSGSSLANSRISARIFGRPTVSAYFIGPPR